MRFFLKLKHRELFLMLAPPSAMTLMFGIPLGVWLIQPGVNALYQKLEQAAADET